MAIPYEFECKACKRTFEIALDKPEQSIKHVHDSHPNARALCQSNTVSRIWSAPASNTYTSLAKPNIDKSKWPEAF